MKKYIKLLLLILVVVFSLLAIKLFYINTNGNFISNFIVENEITEVIITKENINGDIVKEITLNENQIQKLKSLFKNTAFERHLSNTIKYEDKTTFRIIGKAAEGKPFMHLESQGQEFVVVHLSNMVDKPFHQTLLIKNDSWKAIFEDIIAD